MNEPKKKNDINKITFSIIIVIALLLVLMLSIYSVNVSDRLFGKGDKIKTDEYFTQIAEGTTITQSFVSQYNNLKKIYINFEPFKNEYNVGGNVIVGIKDENGNVIKEDKIVRNMVRENTVYKFQFPKQQESKNKIYTLYIKFDDLGKYDKFYSVKYAEYMLNENEVLTINDNAIEGRLDFQLLYQSNKKTVIYATTIMFMTVATVLLSIYIYKKDLKEEKLFLITVPMICILFMISMPTFKNHDEYYHWIRAYETSMGIPVTPIENGIQGSTLHSSIARIMKTDWTTTTYADVKEALKEEIDDEDKSIIDSSTAAVYSCIQYVPQAVGVFISRIFTDKTLLMAYAGRITNMIFAITVLYFAIKLMPFGKKIFLVLAYIPILIEGFSSLSPDAMTISLSFLYIAYILYVSFNEKIKRIDLKRKIILTVLSILIALCKIVYLPLVLLLFLIPKEKFSTEVKESKSKEIKKQKEHVLLDKQNKKKLLNVILIGGIAVVLNLLWLMFTSRYLANFREGDSRYQVMSVLTNPVKYVAQLVYTINLNGVDYLTGMLGEGLGWGELIRLKSLVPLTLAVLIIIEIVTDNSMRNKFKNYQKAIILLTFLIICALIFTSLYVQWTTIGSTSILGVQGRYFIPILPLIILSIGDIIKIKSCYKSENISKVITITGLFLSIITISQIVICHL